MQICMVGLTSISIAVDSSASASASIFPTRKSKCLFLGVWGRSRGSSNGRYRRHKRWVPLAAPPETQDHYAVLGLSSRASSADIKRAYRLLALKYHPDVSKDLHADKVFKNIRLAYEVLSDKAARAEYDDTHRFQEETSKSWRNWTEDHEFDEDLRIYKWDELRQRMRNQRYKQQYDDADDNASSYNKTNTYEVPIYERGPFSEVLKFAFLTLFFMQTLGSQVSLTFCGLTALFDKHLDAGYKTGYLVAWALGGQGGILLTLCLSFASWLCGKSSSSLVVLVVVAMWVGANIARFAPIPQGALLTLLYMSIKLQLDLS